MNWPVTIDLCPFFFDVCSFYQHLWKKKHFRNAIYALGLYDLVYI